MNKLNWISVKDRLPSKDDTDDSNQSTILVLATIDFFGCQLIQICEYNFIYEFFKYIGSGDVTHWIYYNDLPLPKE